MILIDFDQKLLYLNHILVQPHLPAPTTCASLNLKLHNPNDISAPVFGLENSPNSNVNDPGFQTQDLL